MGLGVGVRVGVGVGGRVRGGYGEGGAAYKVGSAASGMDTRPPWGRVRARGFRVGARVRVGLGLGLGLGLGYGTTRPPWGRAAVERGAEVGQDVDECLHELDVSQAHARSRGASPAWVG